MYKVWFQRSELTCSVGHDTVYGFHYDLLNLVEYASLWGFADEQLMNKELHVKKEE